MFFVTFNPLKMKDFDTLNGKVDQYILDVWMITQLFLDDPHILCLF